MVSAKVHGDDIITGMIHHSECIRARYSRMCEARCLAKINITTDVQPTMLQRLERERGFALILL